MEIRVAKTAGFCHGVRRAVRLAQQAAEDGAPCVTLGQLIHNRDVGNMLAEKGIHEIASPEDAKEGVQVIIRSHGIGRAEYETLEQKGCGIIDATCPDVASIHKTVRAESEAGRKILIIGDHDHPEVRAIAGWCDWSYVAATPEEVEKFLSQVTNVGEEAISVVSQTTGQRENFEICVNILKKECTNLKIFDTICFTTYNRQKEAAELSTQCDTMIVIGGKTSANSFRLAEICREKCSRVYFIENAMELKAEMFRDSDIVGITAGASTPQWIIKEVKQKMCDEVKIEEPVVAEATEAEVAAEAVVEAPAAEEHVETFEEMLEKSIKTLYTGDRVKGIVAAITPTEVSVDLGTKQSGYIPMSELSDDPSAKAEDVVKVGDEIESFVVRVNDVEGTVMLSKKRLDSIKSWDDIDAARVNRNAVEGKVIEDNKGGVVVGIRGIKVFIPASQTGLPKEASMSELLGQTVKLRITEVNQARRRVVGSIRAVSYEERKAKAEKIWEEIEVGKEYEGTVKSLTSYGAFVDIGGIDGMVHVSELSWKRVKQPSDVLKIGDVIRVHVLSFDKEKKKISLGHRKLEDNPWFKFTHTYNVGDVADVKIVKLMQFGAFAEVMPGVDGLIHISQIADHRINKPEDVLAVGQEVTVKITDIDNDKQKISLSICALLDQPKAEVVEEESYDGVVYDTDRPNADYE